MEYTYLTIEHPDHEGGTWIGEYRWYWAEDESGKYIETEQGENGEWSEFDAFNTLRALQAWIKRSARDLEKYKKMLAEAA